MKKYLLDLRVKAVEHINEKYVLIRLTDDNPLPEMLPGQFVELRVDNSTETFLRRPISIHYVDRDANELWLLVAVVGEGTRHLAQLKEGDVLNTLLPLGNGFTIPSATDGKTAILLKHLAGIEQRCHAYAATNEQQSVIRTERKTIA